MIKTQNIFFYLIFSFSFLAKAQELPYEDCHWANKEYTDKMLEEVRQAPSPATEAKACSLCSRRELVDQPLSTSLGSSDVKTVADQAGHIPDICFLASMLNTKQPGKRNFYYCQDGGRRVSNWMHFHSCEDASQGKGCSLGLAGDQKSGAKKTVYPRKYCLNKDYVQMTAQAFHETADCFNFTSEEKRDLFKLFNHESGFILNSRSSTNARCYGQVTNDVFHTVNRYIHYKDKAPAWRSQSGIYEDIMEKDECSFLDNKITRLPFEKGYKGSVDQYDARWGREIPNYFSHMTCAATRDPYTCLFYSMYFYKLQQYLFFDEYHSIPKDAGLSDQEQYGSAGFDFYTPIRINQIVVVKGKITRANGQEKEIEWLISSDEELKKTLDTKFTYNRDDLSIQKINVYDEENGGLFLDVTQRSYNGGRKVIIQHFPAYLRRLKERVAAKGSCTAQPSCKMLRDHLLSGRSFSEQDFSTGFSNYFSQVNARRRRAGKSRLQGQPGTFISGIKDDLCYLQGAGKQQNQIKAKLKNSLYSHNLSEAQVDEFVDQVKNLCPGSDIPPEQCK